MSQELPDELKAVAREALAEIERQEQGLLFRALFWVAVLYALAVWTASGWAIWWGIKHILLHYHP